MLKLSSDSRPIACGSTRSAASSARATRYIVKSIENRKGKESSAARRPGAPGGQQNQ
jgi:hypothetical protein